MEIALNKGKKLVPTLETAQAVGVKKINSYLPGFSGLVGRARNRTLRDYRCNVESANAGKPNHLRGWYGHLIAKACLEPRAGERKRGIDRECLFWSFLGQVLRNGSCRDALQEIQAARVADGLSTLSSSTASYCRARRDKFTDEELKGIHREVAGSLMAEGGSFWEGHRVLSVDGTGISLEDTRANQHEFPQPSEQKVGCGFPVMQVVGLHDLSTGALLDYEESPLNAGESTLFHGLDLINKVASGDILLFDRAYCSYLNMATLAMRGAEGIGRLHGSRKIALPKGDNDRVVIWERPASSRRPDYMTLSQWNELPKSIRVRYIRRRIDLAGHRPEEIIVVTTMLDASPDKVLQLFLRRWSMEVSLRDLKTTLGADHIRAKTPQMARKIFAMYMIAHNLIRWTMLQASADHEAPLERLSFKGTLDILENWARLASLSEQKRQHWSSLLQLVASDQNPSRPNRIEPRVRKRRPKTFPKMSRPRQNLRNRMIASKKYAHEGLS